MTPEEKAYVAAQFPRRCVCGRTYLTLAHLRTHTEMVRPAHGGGTNPVDDEFGLTELRNCKCGTTIGAVTLVKDLTKE